MWRAGRGREKIERTYGAARYLQTDEDYGDEIIKERVYESRKRR